MMYNFLFFYSYIYLTTLWRNNFMDQQKIPLILLAKSKNSTLSKIYRNTQAFIEQHKAIILQIISSVLVTVSLVICASLYRSSFVREQLLYSRSINQVTNKDIKQQYEREQQLKQLKSLYESNLKRTNDSLYNCYQDASSCLLDKLSLNLEFQKSLAYSESLRKRLDSCEKQNRVLAKKVIALKIKNKAENKEK